MLYLLYSSLFIICCIWFYVQTCSISRKVPTKKCWQKSGLSWLTEPNNSGKEKRNRYCTISKERFRAPCVRVFEEQQKGAVFVLQNISGKSDVGDSKNADVVDPKKLGICLCLGIFLYRTSTVKAYYVF